MAGINWNEVLVVGLLALCVLGPIIVVLLTQNLLKSTEEIPAEHFDFKRADEAAPIFGGTSSALPDSQQPPASE